MKIAAPVGSVFVLLGGLLSGGAAQAQVVGGYSTIVPTQIGSSPVFDSAPLYHATTNESSSSAAPHSAAPRSAAQHDAAPIVAVSTLEADRAARAAALNGIEPTMHSVLKRTGGKGDIITANYQAPAQFTPADEQLSPIPITMNYQGGAPYYAPTMNSQVIPVQASAPVAVAQGACCNPCITCCMPVAQQYAPVQQYATVQPTVLQQPVAVASVPAQLPPNHVFGRGILFQPVVYVQGQPLRNALRFISP